MTMTSRSGARYQVSPRDLCPVVDEMMGDAMASESDERARALEIGNCIIIGCDLHVLWNPCNDGSQ